MRDQEDQMDHGSIGRTRGSGHVRIPQRRINRSLRSGVTPSMQQPTAGNGQFQNGVHISPRVQPVRQMGPARGRMFQQFMNRNQPNLYNRLQHTDHPHQGANNPNGGNHNPFTGGRNAWKGGPNGGMRFPGGRPPMPVWGTHPGGPNTQFPPQGGRPPFGPTGPILGHGQTMNGMIQAIMGDLGQGINPEQFANMQAGSLPGGEHGDFLRALGAGDMNNNPLQALITHLIQGPAGADGTPGNYMINGDQGGAIAQLLRQAIGNNPNYNPPPPPNWGGGRGGRGGGRFGGRVPYRGTRYMPWNSAPYEPLNTSGGMPVPMGIPQAGMPR